MPPQWRQTRNSDTIVISLSSDTSKTNEDSAPESDAGNPSKSGRYAAGNDRSARQAGKINSGRFGMFNSPTLTPRTRSTPDSGNKRTRTKAYKVHRKYPPRKSSRKRKREVSEPVDLTGQNEDESSLFVSEEPSQSSPVRVEIEYEVDSDDFYGDMPLNRTQKVQEYLDTLDLVEIAGRELQVAETELMVVTTEQMIMSKKLTTIDATAENRITDIIRERDEAIRLANKIVDSKIKGVRNELSVEKTRHDERFREFEERKNVIEEIVKGFKARLEVNRTTKSELERRGGFELCSDVRDVQARRK